MATGPDKGFAWVIALACFVINFIMAGLARTAGILYVALIDLYGVSREAATTPFSIRVCVRNMTGPIIGYLGQKYGIRGVTTIGGLIAGLGSILCYFAPNIFWITMFWGVIHGLGFGLSTVLHMMSINQYFDKYKASALGLGYSGDCFGTFAFPVIMEYLFSKYDVRGTFLIIGGIVLNVIPMALLLREPPWIASTKPRKRKKKAIKVHTDLKKESYQNGSENVLNNKMYDEKQKDLGPLNTINENNSLKKENADCPPVYENVSVGKKSLCVKRSQLTGQCNKAFQSSETDLSSLKKENEMRNLAILNSCKAFSNQEPTILVTSHSEASNLSQFSNETFPSSGLNSSNSSINDFKNLKTPDDHAIFLEIRTSRSVSDLNQRNGSHSPTNRSLRLGNVRSTAFLDRRESMPNVLEREMSLKVKQEIVKSNENTNKEDELGEMECPRTDCTGRKRRTSSFVGQVAQDIVNRMRTASFASQVAQDAFVSPFTHEPESEPEQKSECELKSIVEHIDHDTENCTHHDLILSVDKNMMNDYYNEPVDRPNSVAEVRSKPPSILKVMIRTNTKPMFILISLSMAVYAFLFVSVLTIIIDYAVDLGVSNDQGKYLVIGFSVADLIGRLSFGQVLDRNLMKMKNYSGCTMLIMGTVVAAIPLNVSFNYMMVCMCMYGLVQGGTAIMFPILVNIYMDKDTESVAMGCLNFYGGLLMLLMAPMIGFFRDNTGSYNCVFYIIGGVVAVVGIIWQFEPMIVKYQNRKLREKYIMREVSMMQPNQ